jgi:hypothetical protein
LQFAHFHFDCFEFNPNPSHSGSIGNCGFYSHSVYPVHHFWPETQNSRNVYQNSQRPAEEFLIVPLSFRVFKTSPPLQLHPYLVLQEALRSHHPQHPLQVEGTDTVEWCQVPEGDH